MDFSSQLKFVLDSFGLLMQGLGITLLIAFFALLIGLVIGIILAMIKIAPKTNPFIKFADKVANIYITVIRGTPMLLQLLIMYFVILAPLKDGKTNLVIPIIAFGINSGAYMAEIIRSGINSIDKGQMEAGRSLGFNWTQTMLKIVIPQAIKVVIPTMFNEIIVLVKETSVVYCIVLRMNWNQVWDLLTMAKQLGLKEPGAYVTLIVTAGILYLLVVLLLTWVQRLIEKRFAKNERKE